MDTPVVRITLARARRLAPAGTVPSPCVGVCRMSPATGLCEGCWRSLDEIAAWSRADDAQRLRTWTEIEARQPVAPVPGAGGS
jgi:hypothetical protein